MKGTRKTTRWSGRVVTAVAVLAVCGALACRADWAQAESPDFSLDTTVPEPGLVMLYALGAAVMAVRTRKRALLCMAGGALLLAGTSEAGRVVVTNVTAQRRPNYPLVDISYDLLNPSGWLHLVTVEVSTNRGVSYLADCTNFNGALGSGMTTGEQKQVVWYSALDLPGVTGVLARVRVTAYEEHEEMVYLSAGTFTMGDAFSEGDPDERPAHDVHVKGFYMDKHEVTKATWEGVYQWAINHGYSFDNAGSMNADDHPVYMVNWYDCVKWCNARSEMEGRKPCYYLDGAKTVVYRSGQSNIWNGATDWDANGYRLPTEAEWEKAARGGLAGRRFPWHDLNITHTNANYFSSALYVYDTSIGKGYHPAWMSGTYPFTTRAGYFAPNGDGLHDMVGNVWEWCWDWHGKAYYGTSPVNDPRGPASGTHRVLRGGSWRSYAYYCRAAYRGMSTPEHTWDCVGFRTVRR